ncbi:hypothetical protein GSF67_11335 [Agrobacterium sp. CGMCC 11546]|nr:hypothetical protein GSF67_11335 [Agrobacterium sp. CGMCC 11546]
MNLRNIDRFHKDLDALTELGESLQFALIKALHGGTKLTEILKKAGVSDERVQQIIQSNLVFSNQYEAWYTESLALVRQLIPDRAKDFIGMYEKPKGRRDITYGNYVIQDYLQGLRVTRHGDVIVDGTAAVPQYQQQLNILMAAKRRFESSLFEIKQLVQADLLDSEIGAAQELHKSGFLRAAGAVAGVVLEKHLGQVCDNHQITISKKHPGIADLNELLKANGVIDVAQWRHVGFLADIRNLCDHNKKSEPTSDNIRDIIDGTNKVLKTIT